MTSPALTRGGQERTAGRLMLMLSVVAALLGLGAASTVIATAAPAQAADRQEINILANHSNKCIQASAATSGAEVKQQACTGDAQAVWYMKSSPRGGGAIQVVNAYSGLCLQAPNFTAPGVQQGVCDSTHGSSFKIADAPGTAGEQGAALLMALKPSAHSTSPDRCLEVAGSSLNNGALLQQSNCAAQAGAAFKQQTKPVTETTIVNVNSQKCLAIPAGSPLDDTRVSQTGCTGTLNQTWRVIGAGGQAVSLVNANTGKCLQVKDATADYPARVVQSACDGSAGQGWLVEAQANGTKKIANAVSKKYMSVVGGSVANGAEVEPVDISATLNWQINA